MNFLRGLMLVVLFGLVAACGAERQDPEQGPDSAGASPEALGSAVPGESTGEEGSAGAVDGQGAASTGQPPEPVAETAPPELDLTLPRELDIPGETAFPPESPAPDVLLPDLFQKTEKKRRTKVSGELILGDGEEHERQLDRIQGGTVEVEVSID